MTRLFRTWLRIICAAGLLAGCYVPNDPEGTLQKIETDGVLRIGMVADPLPAADRRAIDQFAESVGARAAYVTGPAHALLAGLEDGQIHLLAGDIPESTPWSKHAALSNPFPPRVMLPGRSEKRVLLLRKGENRFLLRLNRSLRQWERLP